MEEGNMKSNSIYTTSVIIVIGFAAGLSVDRLFLSAPTLISTKPGVIATERTSSSGSSRLSDPHEAGTDSEPVKTRSYEEVRAMIASLEKLSFRERTGA